ncbi:MAG: RNA polymerase II C-terminal domain phosphatase family protein [Candidatus Omnitrophota bacterium]
MAAMRTLHEAVGRLHLARKLTLVLDLDETLTSSPRGDGGETLIEPRPYVHRFLEETSRTYELCLYTHATAEHARRALAILDPLRSIFGGRVHTRGDSSLDVPQKHLLPEMGGSRMAVAVDDRHDVWKWYAANLIQIEPFNAFPLPTQCAVIDWREDRALLSVAANLAVIHAEFYRRVDMGGWPIMRDVIRDLRGGVLSGAVLAFSCVVPPEESLVDSYHWRVATALGAVCVREVTAVVTHLVARIDGVHRVTLAKELGTVNVVSLEWLDAAIGTWTRPDETLFAVPTLRDDDWSLVRMITADALGTGFI